MRSEKILILWDGSHIWGHMALRGLRSLGYACRLVKSIEITQGALRRKGADALAVPGGSARGKFLALGSIGASAIRDWLSSGGVYLGFCGGAGIALTQADGESLALCPWTRARYARRLDHMLSGHVLAVTDRGDNIRLPVWWPGRFAREDGDVRVLASYASPTEDLWLADKRVSESADPRFRAAFPRGEPLIVAGKFGAGRYILSYAHLETPESPQSGPLLKRLLGGGGNRVAAPWSTDPRAVVQSRENGDAGEALIRAAVELERLIEQGAKLGLFFRRTSWLIGWREGAPGIAINNLRVALAETTAARLSADARELWFERGGEFEDKFREFIAGARESLLADRTRENGSTDDEIQGALVARRESLFGRPMPGGGLIGELTDFVEELFYLSQVGNRSF